MRKLQLQPSGRGKRWRCHHITCVYLLTQLLHSSHRFLPPFRLSCHRRYTSKWWLSSPWQCDYIVYHHITCNTSTSDSSILLHLHCSSCQPGNVNFYIFFSIGYQCVVLYYLDTCVYVWIHMEVSHIFLYSEWKSYQRCHSGGQRKYGSFVRCSVVSVIEKEK